jgi:hypothetical protein
MTEKRRVAAAGAVLLAGYAWFLFRHNTFCVGGSDSSGYLNAAQRMVAGKLVDRPRTLDRLTFSDAFTPIFIPLGFALGPKPGTMVPFYPCGYPGHMVLAAVLFGWARGPYLVSPICALGSLWLFYLLARELALSRSWAAVGTAIFGAWPIFLFQAIQPMSDTVATFWSLAAVLTGLKARGNRTWALATGAAFGIAVLVRPTSVLLAVPLAAALPLSAPALALFVLGGTPFAAGFAAYNLHCYGGVVLTGYQKATLSDDLAPHFFFPRFRHYWLWLGRTLTPIVPLTWIAAACDRCVARRERFLLLSWFATFFLFYCFYQPYDSFIFLRFLLPAVPALLIGGLLAVRDLVSAIPRRSLAVGVAALVGAGIFLQERAWTQRLGVLDIAQGEAVYPRSCALAERIVPSEGIVLSMQVSGSLEHYTRLSYARWDWIEPARWSFMLSRTVPQGRRWFALLYPFERQQLDQHTPGRWREIGRVDQIALLELEP